MSANTNATIVLSIFAFYIGIIVILGLVNDSLHTAVTSSGTITQPEQPTLLGFLGQAISILYQGMVFSIFGLPVWATTLLFLPLAVVIGYIAISLLRGSS